MLALALTAIALGAPLPTPIGSGPQFRLPAASPAVVRAAPVGRLACLRTEPVRERAHVELYANRRVLLLPPGIGMAPPLRRHGPDVLTARCSYAIRTTDPTGVVEYLPSARPTLADLFAVWGQPLSARRVAGFRTRRGEAVSAWVGGRRWHGDVSGIPLTRNAEIVLELGGYVPPHRSFVYS